MRENLKKRLDVIEGIINQTKPMEIYRYTDEELIQIIAEGEGEDGAPLEKLLIMLNDLTYDAKKKNRKP